MRRHPRRARVDPYNPQAWATSDLSGMIGNHNDMVWVYEWAGNELINKKLLCFPEELDKPQRQLGTLVLPPDPLPIMNARPEQYYIDEQTYLVAQNGQQLYSQGNVALLASNLQGAKNAGTDPS